MVRTTATLKLDAPAQKVWDLIGGFNSLADWQPAVAKSVLVDLGRVRRLTMADGNTIVQTLLWSDDDERAHSYSMDECHLPVANYVGTLGVIEEDDGSACRVEWSCTFDPAGVSADDARRVIEEIHQRGLDRLKALFGAG